MKFRVLAWSLVALLSNGCASSKPDDASAARHESASSPSVVRIATDATFPPFHYLTDFGLPTGYDVELAKEALGRAGHTVDVVVVRPYERLWTGLAQGEFDCVAATTGITRARREQWLLSEPYYITAQVAVVRAGRGEPQNLVDLRNKRVGAAGSGTSWLAAQSIHGANAMQLGKGQAGIPALLTGEIDALIVDEYEGVRAASESGGALRVLGAPVALEQYAIVFPKSKPELHQSVNDALDGMRRDGTLAQLRERFGLIRPSDWPVAVDVGALKVE